MNVTQFACGEFLDDSHQLLQCVALGFGDAEQLVQLSHRHKDSYAHHETVHHRFGEKLRDKTQLCQAGCQKDQPGDQNKSRRISLIRLWIGNGFRRCRHQRRGNRGSKERCRGRSGLHRQMARGAEKRINKERSQKRIETPSGEASRRSLHKPSPPG